MKKLLSVLAFVMFWVLSAPATAGFDSVPGDKACVSGFVRDQPHSHYCRASPIINDAVPSGGGPACFTSNALLPAGATYVKMLVALTANSTNAVGYRGATVYFNSSSPAGGTQDVIAVLNAFEFVATPSTEIAAASIQLDVPLAANGQYCFRKAITGGAGTWARTQILGYYD